MNESTHTFFTIIMAIVGLVLISLYFLIINTSSDYIKVDDKGSTTAATTPFSNSIAGIFALGIVFITASGWSLYIEQKHGKAASSEMFGGEGKYMGIMMVTAIMALALALNSLRYLKKKGDVDYPASGCIDPAVWIKIIIGLSSVAGVVGGYYSVGGYVSSAYTNAMNKRTEANALDTEAQGGDDLGFDFEF